MFNNELTLTLTDHMIKYLVVLFTESSDWYLDDESFTKFVYCEELLLRQAIWTMNRIVTNQH